MNTIWFKCEYKLVSSTDVYIWYGMRPYIDQKFTDIFQLLYDIR